MKSNYTTMMAAAILVAVLAPIGGTAAAQQRSIPIGGTAEAQQRLIPIEGYAAKVNDRVILLSDVKSMVRDSEARLRDTLEGDELRQALAKIYQDALDLLIERQLILAEYADKEGQIPEQAVEDQIAQIIAERFGGDRSELLKGLQQERISYAEWRRQIEDQLIISVMRREAVFDKVSLSPNAARRRYDKDIVKLWMISVGRGTTPEELIKKAALIKDAQSRLEFGEGFATVAREISEGIEASSGGDKGWLPSGDLHPELAKIVDQLEVGQLSRIVAAGDNLYLLWLEDRRPEFVVPFAEVREELERDLRRAEIARIQQEWTARLRNKHYVQVY